MRRVCLQLSESEAMTDFKLEDSLGDALRHHLPWAELSGCLPGGCVLCLFFVSTVERASKLAKTIERAESRIPCWSTSKPLHTLPTSWLLFETPTTRPG